MKLFLFIFKINFLNAFVTNANIVIIKEQINFNEILISNNLVCHLQSSRIKSFTSANEKLNRILTPKEPTFPSNVKHDKINDIYFVPDLIGFRFVFYDKSDLLKFYHHLIHTKKIMYSKNYINEPKDNGYSAIHLRYKNEYSECPVKLLECQLYIIDDYYNSIYGNAKNTKNYSYFY